MGALYKEIELSVTNGSWKSKEALSVPEGKTYTIQAMGFKCDNDCYVRAKDNSTIIFDGTTAISTQWGNFYPYPRELKGGHTLTLQGKLEETGTKTLYCMIYYFDE